MSLTTREIPIESTLFNSVGDAAASLVGQSEYTHPVLQQAFEHLMLPILNITAKTPPDTISDAEATDLKNALEEIIRLSKEGFNPNGRSSVTILEGTSRELVIPVSSDDLNLNHTFYFTVEQADVVAEVVRSLEAVGVLNIDLINSSATSDTLFLWADLFKQGLNDFVDKVTYQTQIDVVDTMTGEVTGTETVTAFIDSTKTLQALVMTEYVRAGNELITEKLGELESALTLNKQALDHLQVIQDVKNQIKAGEFSWEASGVSSPVDSAHVPIACAQATQSSEGGLGPVFCSDSLDAPIEAFSSEFNEFDDGIGVNLNIPSIPDSLLEDFQQAVIGLDNIRTQLSDQNPGTETPEGSLLDKLNDLFDFAGGTNDLLSMVQTADDPPVLLPFDNSPTSFRNRLLFSTFLEDNYGSDTATEVGEIQKLVNDSISAAQNLNDSQKNELKKFMFVFEEFYKSAANILSLIDRIINKMASNIAR